MAGSVSSKQTVYKDNAAAVAWSNPLVLDSGGNLPSGGEVWFPQGQNFKVVFAPATDGDPPTSPYWSKDNLSGINDVSAQTGVEWISGPAPTFVGTTQFTLVGDQTATFTVNRRIKTTNTGGTVYSTITKSAFGVLTTIDVVNDSGVLDSGLSAVFYGLFDPSNPSIAPTEVNRKGGAVASSGTGTTNIWGSVGDYIHVTGTNNIFSFSTAPYAGARKSLVFDGALTLMSSGVMQIAGNSNISTSANDRAVVRADTTTSYVFESFISASTGSLGIPQSSGTVYAGPLSTAPAVPAFRTLSAWETDWQLLKTFVIPNNTSLVATGSSDVNFAAYQAIKFQFYNLRPGTDSHYLTANVSWDGGATYKTDSSYQHAGQGLGSNGAIASASSVADSKIVATDFINGMANNAILSSFVEFTALNPSSSSNSKVFIYDAATVVGGATNIRRFSGAAEYTSTVAVGSSNAISGIRFQIDTGNISTGTMFIWGLKNT